MALGKRLINTGGVAACNTDSVQAFGADSAFSSNIALYQLDGDGGVTNNVPDTTTNYDGTASNVTYATGQFGNAAVFDGSSSYVLASSFMPTGSNPRSASAWVKTTISNANMTILFSGSGSNNNAFIFRVINGNLGVAFYANDHDFTATGLTDGNWHHVVATYDGSVAKVYLDGNLIGTGSAGAVSTNSGNFAIGAYNNGVDALFNGSIDQVRIFDKAISAEDVATLYAETTSTASNTNPFSEGAGVALYTMDYDASEASGYYDGTPTNVDFGVEGQINYGARFNGSSSRIALPKLTGLTSDVSVSGWFQLGNTTTSNRLRIFSLNAVSGYGGTLESLYRPSDGQWVVRVGNGSSSDTNVLTHTYQLTQSTWYHICFTRDDSNNITKFYVNGSEQDTETVSATATIQGSAISIIGNQPSLSTSTAWNGTIDQVRIFSKALNPTEVDTLFAETACVYTSTTDIVDYPTSASNDIVAYYKMDNSSEDFKGSNDGTDTNIEYRFGRFGQAAVFNGSSSGIFISSTGTSVTDYDQDFSISCWFRFDSGSTGGNLNFLFMGGGTENVQMWVTLANGVRFQLYNSGATYKVDTGAINAGVFYHVVATRSKTDGLKIYLDSVEKDTDSYTGNANPGLSGKDSIGQYFNGTRNNFEGVIDQVRIYSTALDSNQVTELYNEKPEVDTSNFKAVLYEGNDATKHFVSNVGLDLDVDNGGDGGLVWVKNRDGAFNHILVDSIRGANNLLFSDTTAAALTSNTTLLSSLEKTGFL